ncbi:NAD(P)/FAD-dependent oxidoreductase [Rhodococcus sp. NPDC056960]|uniref:NAD(P)/FAD-dependent oxidoreductase n=1 Tax=Rhodococcus sp. NPDC056960 TaxID=3345982 RepID=UPI00363A465C
MSNVLIIGGGFAGVWAAASAARLRRDAGVPREDLTITLVDAGDDHVIRPRLYERDPESKRCSLDGLLGPIGVERVAATITSIDTAGNQVHGVARTGRATSLSYDRLILATGSQLVTPAVVGAEHLFDIDTLGAAAYLDGHLRSLPARPDSEGRYTVVVVGAGFTGLEIATELTDRLREIAGGGPVRVILVDRNEVVGSGLGEGPRPAIVEALDDLGIEVRLGVEVASVDPDGVWLADGTRIDSHTVIWTAGMEASPLTAHIPGERDRLGRLTVDAHLRVAGLADVFAAGDTAAAYADPHHIVMQSCQHALPQGKFVGYNAVADLLGRELVPFTPVSYVTCLALGPAGAVFSSGWDRQVQMTGEEGAVVKKSINTVAIYPPVGDPEALLSLAVPDGAWPSPELAALT